MYHGDKKMMMGGMNGKKMKKGAQQTKKSKN